MYSGRGAACEMGYARLLGAIDAVTSWDDRDAAIASLQKSFRVTDADEVQSCYLKPDGETLRELVDNGDVAEKLMAGGPAGPQQYIYMGAFDREAFEAGYRKAFRTNGRFNAASIPSLLDFLKVLEEDPAMMDIRWMAYMLGTALIESSHLVIVPGKPKPKRLYLNFSPIDEDGHGKGRDYYLPVKVKRLIDGRARVTEQDGDQFLVSVGTAPRYLSRRAPNQAQPPAPPQARSTWMMTERLTPTTVVATSSSHGGRTTRRRVRCWAEGSIFSSTRSS
jgi:hypothetical protein